jgi:RIP homotypic interaction motif
VDPGSAPGHRPAAAASVTAADPGSTGSASRQVRVSGSQGLQIGDHNVQVNVYDNAGRGKPRIGSLSLRSRRIGGRTLTASTLAALAGVVTGALLFGARTSVTAARGVTAASAPSCSKYVVRARDLTLRDADGHPTEQPQLLSGQQVEFLALSQTISIRTLVKVKAADGRTGWVDGTYLQSDCPSRH